jgi:hypothetical protein
MADTTVPTPASAQAEPTSLTSPTPPADVKPKWPGEQARTNMGWDTQVPAGTDWPYTIISEELFDAEYSKVARIMTALDGRADGASFQPADPATNQDRLSVQEWALKDGTWTFAAVFDGKTLLSNSARNLFSDTSDRPRRRCHRQLRRRGPSR